MSKAALQFGGHVRGIIGDRVMVLFDKDKAFTNALWCASLMNSVSQFVINKHFKANEVTCGIGIDAGKMLVTKTGIRKNGQQRHNYKNLVWLGRPANVPSKLTDLANKPAEGAHLGAVKVGLKTSLGADDFNWRWVEYLSWDFIKHIRSDTLSHAIQWNDPNFRSIVKSQKWVETKAATPPILMSRAVYAGFAEENPEFEGFAKGWFNQVAVSVPGFDDTVWGCNMTYTIFCE